MPVAGGARRLDVVGRPVAIDDQTRVSREHRGRSAPASPRVSSAGPMSRAMLPGRELRQSEPCERGGKRPTRVIADQGRGRHMFVEDDVGRRVGGGPEQRPAAGSCGGESGHGWQMNKRVWIVPRPVAGQPRMRHSSHPPGRRAAYYPCDQPLWGGTARSRRWIEPPSDTWVTSIACAGLASGRSTSCAAAERGSALGRRIRLAARLHAGRPAGGSRGQPAVDYLRLLVARGGAGDEHTLLNKQLDEARETTAADVRKLLLPSTRPTRSGTTSAAASCAR